jgi:hypothetical protein
MLFNGLYGCRFEAFPIMIPAGRAEPDTAHRSIGQEFPLQNAKGDIERRPELWVFAAGPAQIGRRRILLIGARRSPWF